MAVPIALVEGLTPAARRTPWLNPLGLAITAVIFVLGCVVTFTFQQQNPFMASSLQFLVSAAVVVLLVALAILLGRARTSARVDAQTPPAAPVVGGVAFIIGSTFMLLAILVDVIPASLNVAGMIVLWVLGSALIWYWSRRSGWSELHRVAVAGGLLLTYAWYGFIQVPSTGDTSPLIDTVGNIIFASGALILLMIAWKKASATSGTGAWTFPRAR
jgi:hypothetical protein